MSYGIHTWALASEPMLIEIQKDGTWKLVKSFKRKQKLSNFILKRERER
jgi:hypothetical protein